MKNKIIAFVCLFGSLYVSASQLNTTINKYDQIVVYVDLSQSSESSHGSPCSILGSPSRFEKSPKLFPSPKLSPIKKDTSLPRRSIGVTTYVIAKTLSPLDKMYSLGFKDEESKFQRSLRKKEPRNYKDFDFKS